jgi:hypothetical protein
MTVSNGNKEAVRKLAAFSLRHPVLSDYYKK